MSTSPSAIEVSCRGHPNRGAGRPERNLSWEAGFAVVQINMALAPLAMGHGEIHEPVMIA
jgi:hypothetical protein